MNNEGMKEVLFDQYCSRCVYAQTKDEEGKDPCNECLSYPMNQYSHRPMKWEEKV